MNGNWSDTAILLAETVRIVVPRGMANESVAYLCVVGLIFYLYFCHKLIVEFLFSGLVVPGRKWFVTG